jgi:predicted transcriptional regulator
MSVRVNLRLPDDLWGAVCTAADGAGQTRTMFVRRALEAALSGHGGVGDREAEEGRGVRQTSPEPNRTPSSPAAPPRAPEVPGAGRKQHGEANFEFDRERPLDPDQAATLDRLVLPHVRGGGRPERHQFASGEEWQAAVRAWKGK